MKLSLVAGIAGLTLAGVATTLAGPIDPATMLCGLSAASPFEAGFEKSGVAFGSLNPDSAIPACREAVAAAPDSAAAKAWLARSLLAAENYDEALPLLEASSDAGNGLAQQLLGDIYLGNIGDGSRQDYDKGYKALLPAAEAGFAPAQASLGMAYDSGRGVTEDDKLAAQWYRKAADQGEARAQGNLGYLYHVGSGIERDYVAAKRWYQLSADQDDVVGIYGMGQLYEYGEGVEQDYAKAMEYFRRGADLGDSYAENDVGYLYDAGLGVNVDPAEAAYWYQRASDQGYALASANLAQLYSTGRGVDRDFEQAFALYSYAHEQGEVGGTIGLAQAYLYGEGVAVDYAQALSLAQEAADKDATYGETTLAQIYAEGLGVPRDIDKALALFDKAATDGNGYGADRAKELRAERACGEAAASPFEDGWQDKGVALEQINTDTALLACENALALDPNSLEDKTWLARARMAVGDDKQAAPLLEEAAEGEWPPGMTLLADLLLWGHGTDEDPARAMVLYRAAAEMGFTPALFGIGVAYQNGRGVPVDLDAAARWYQQAADKGFATARDRLYEIEQIRAQVSMGPQRAGGAS